MTPERSTLLRDALTLPLGERADMAAALLASLEERRLDGEDEVRDAWSAEVEHRARRARAGDDPGEAWALVTTRVRRTLAG